MIENVELIELRSHPDARGDLTEIFRSDWVPGRVLQWNLVRSDPNVLRGMHVHVRRHDYIVPVAGRFSVGLSDLREGTPTFGEARVIELSSERPQLLVIPPGVAHGFYGPEATTLAYGLSTYWDAHDDFGCRWNDPELGVAWTAIAPVLSDRDASALPRAALLERLRDLHPKW